jgi:acyl-ACP thioesterase
MENTRKEKLLIPASRCDHTARLSVPDTFALFMDMATDHANDLGIGMADLSPRHLFWLTVKTKVRFLRRPAMSEPVEAETWPEPAERIRCSRDYRLRTGEEVLALGKTEWTVVNTETGKLHPTGEIYPAGVEMRTDTVWPEPFARLRDDFDGVDVFARHTVCSTDIDIGGHMNNVAYVRALAGAFSTAGWDALDAGELEIHFKASCYEGDVIEMQQRRTDGGLDVRMSVDGRTVVLARIA